MWPQYAIWVIRHWPYSHTVDVLHHNTTLYSDKLILMSVHPYVLYILNMHAMNNIYGLEWVFQMCISLCQQCINGILRLSSVDSICGIMLITTKIYLINFFFKIQCPPLILAPLVNMSKGGCENKSALFILFIFHSENSQNSNLSLK